MRNVGAGGSCSSVAEHWQLKPEESWVRFPVTVMAGFLIFPHKIEHDFSVVSMVAAWYITYSVYAYYKQERPSRYVRGKLPWEFVNF